MRYVRFSSVVATILLAGCVIEPTVPVKLESFTLRASITPDGRCTVEAMGKNYSSIGQVIGAKLPTFIGDVDNAGYHAVGCWVGTADGWDGALSMYFPGNSFNQPFPTGTFLPRFEPPYGVSDKLVSVTFLASIIPGEKLKTVDESTGSVVVESGPSGSRTIRVDVTVVRIAY